VTRSCQTLEAALRYAQHGWAIFPCRPRLKVPATAHGLLDATTDLGLIAAWWEQQPDANVGVVTGRTSGLVVLDVDGDTGIDSLRNLERLPATASVTTPRGGLHLYFQHPGIEVRNSAGQLGAGLDVRGDGGYVLAPPSQIAGRHYTPSDRAPLASMPEWLLERLSAPRDASHRTPATEWIRIVRVGLPEGQRNAGLARIVGHLLRRYVDIDLTAELAHLINARCRPPLDTAEVDRIVDSIAGRELRRRQRTTP
jgi:hypothetical protein